MKALIAAIWLLFWVGHDGAGHVTVYEGAGAEAQCWADRADLTEARDSYCVDP